jgi:hypothetical protein
MEQKSGHDEAAELIGLADALAGSRPDLAETAQQVRALVDAAVGFEAPIDMERGFEQAAGHLRGGWLKSVAAETSRVLRSPTEHEVERLERGRHDAYGYERDFQPETLEARCEALFGPAPAGWTPARLLFSSGQAAHASVLLHLAAHRPRKLRVAHVGAYFETRELVERACTPVVRPSDADCVIVEPIACDGRFSAHDPAVIAADLASDQVLVVDETLLAPRSHVPTILGRAGAPGPAVIRLVSGLKLLQQGLELANVGIVSIFARDAERVHALAQDFSRCRTLTGAGLRFVDALALEAPFFLDAAATWAYAQRVFAHNAELARAVMGQNRIFKPLGDADVPGEAAPYCAFQLHDGSLAALESLAEVIDTQAKARGLLFQRGGSFGFRGHRYDVIEPESGEPPFLRVALGARDDRSRRGVTELIVELAAGDGRLSR